MSTRFLISASGALIAIPIIFSAPYWGLPILVTIYFVRPSIWGAPSWFQPVFILTAVTVISLLFNAFRGKVNFNVPLLAKLYLLLLAILYVSATQAVVSTKISYEYVVSITKLVVLMILIMNLVDSVKRFNILMWTIIFGIGYLIKNALYLYIVYGYTRVETIGGQGGGSEYLAYLITMTFPFLYLKITEPSSNIEKWISLICLPYWLSGFILANTRAGLLALLVLAPLLVLKTPRKIYAALAITALGVALLFFAPEHFWDRMATISTYQEDASASSRLDFWQIAINLFLENPWLGVGPDNFRDLSVLYSTYRNKDTGGGQEAHNILIQLLAEGGIFAFAIFLLIIFIYFNKLRKLRKSAQLSPTHSTIASFSTGLELAMIVFLVNSMFLSTFHNDVLYWYLAFPDALQSIAKKCTKLNTTVHFFPSTHL